MSIEAWLREAEEKYNSLHNRELVSLETVLNELGSKYGIYPLDLESLHDDVLYRIAEALGLDPKNYGSRKELIEAIEYASRDWETFTDGSHGGLGLWAYDDKIILVEGTYYKHSDSYTLDYRTIMTVS